MMNFFSQLKVFLSDETNQYILSLIGGIIVTVVGWAIYLRKSKKKESSPTQVIADGGSVAAGRDINVGGNLITGLTEEKLETIIKDRLDEILKAISASASGSEQRALLEMELAALEQKRTHLEESLQATQKVYADTVQLLEEKLSAQLPPNRIEQAKTAIAQGDPALAESLLQEVVKSGMQQSAEASYRLGLLAKDRVDYENAWQALTRAAELAPDNALYLNEAGLMADNLGRYDSAMEYYDKALAIYLETLGPDHPDVATLWNNLGLAWKAKGEHEKAIEYLEKALASGLKTSGPDHSQVAIYWNSMGLAWKAKGEYNKAIEHYEKALASDLKTFGPDHPKIAIRWNNLGSVWKDKGEYDKAIEYYEKALASDLKTFGPDHPQVATYWNNLGLIWSAKGEIDKAIEYYEKALASDLKTLGPDHPNFAIRWNNLGVAWKDKGDTGKAREYYEKALGVFQKSGQEHFVKVLENNIRSLPPA
ncbi:MAG: tetratricopeptide repeat protein [Nitrospinae bacterium]|nr:tetratricopeptide repeat protein [Nitrospinota bacterium]